jgi:hypothetical protein
MRPRVENSHDMLFGCVLSIRIHIQNPKEEKNDNKKTLKSYRSTQGYSLFGYGSC